MKKVDFYSLPRAAQDRLLASFRGQLVPSPILFSPSTRKEALAWLGVAALGALGLVLLVEIGFGNAESALSLHPTPLVVVYAVLASMVAVGLLQAGACRGRVRALPFAPGFYLFPACLIDAREPKLRVYPLESLARVSPGPGAHVSLDFGGARFPMPIADAGRTAEAIELVESARARLQGSLDHHARFELDPLEAPSTASPLGPQNPIARSAPIWEQQSILIGVVAGCLLGGAIFQLRNGMSDNKMLAIAQAKNDVAGYRAYLTRGKKHRVLVGETLLPRAELRLAIAEGSVEAILAFKDEHPHTAIEQEVEIARKNAMVAAFEQARGAGTLAALLSFAERHPDHGLDEPFKAARHALFVTAKKRIKDSVPQDEDKVMELVGKLLSYSEKVGAHKAGDRQLGPAVQIRFQRLATQTLERADSAVSKNPMFNGPVSYPSRYFDAPKLEPHEKELASDLAQRLSGKFEPEMLSFAEGPPVEGTSEDVPNIDTPTLILNYRIEWSGGAFASRKPRGVLVGTLFFFKTTFAIPADAEPMRTKYTASGPIPHDVLDAQPSVPPAGTVETAIYEAETKNAMAEFRDKYLQKWFGAAAAQKPE